MNVVSDEFRNLDINKLAQAYAQRAFVKLPNLFHHDFITYIQNEVAKREYTSISYTKIWNEDRIEDKAFCNRLNFLLSAREFLSVIEKIIGVPKVMMTSSRVYRLTNSSHHYIDWHNDDMVPNRISSLRFELSTSPYKGGEFELREIGKTELLTRQEYVGFGDTTLFKVDFNKLEHRVLPVTEGERISLILWFLRP